MVGGALLALSVFLPWYETGNSNSTIASDKGANLSVSAWNALPVWRWLLLAAAVAPFILAWIIVRDHELSWPRGEMTAVVGLTAFGLILVKGFIYKPGEPTGQISLCLGCFLALLGTILILVGALRALHRDRTVRKPPGVL